MKTDEAIDGHVSTPVLACVFQRKWFFPTFGGEPKLL